MIQSGAPNCVLAEDCSGLVNMKLWRGSCFDVQSSIHRKPCPAKIGLWGELWKLGVAVSWWVHQARDTHPCQKSDAVGTSFLRSRGPSFFFLSRPCATGRSQEIIDGRITLEPSQPDPSCSTTTTQLRWPSSMLQPTTLRPFLTLQTHDENPPHPLLVRPRRRIRGRRRRQQRQ